MARSMTFVQVLVSSPSDLVDERDIVAEAVAELNTTWRKSGSVQLAVLRWETDTRPAIGGSPQSIVNAQLGDDYDIFIGIMGARFGTPTDAAGSGTEEESDRAVKRLDQNASS